MYPSRRIVPAHQAYGYAGSGFAGRTGFGLNPGGAGRGDHNPTTPTRTPQSAATTFKVNDVVVLLTNCDVNFPRGTVVQITSIEKAPVSTSKGEVGWLQTDEDSLYRFQRRYLRKNEEVITSEEFGNPTPHSELVPGPGRPCDVNQYPLGSVLWTLKDRTFLHDDRRRRVQVPKHTYCKVIERTTRKGGKAAGRVMETRTLVNSWCYYILQAKYVTYTWDTEICIRKKEVGNFRKATPEEYARYNDTNVPPGNVVNWQ